MKAYTKLPEPPFRGRYKTIEEYEEALAYWQHSVGRIQALVDSQKARSKNSQEYQEQEVDD